MPPKLITAAQAAEALGITIATVHRRAVSRGIGATMGAMRLFKESELIGLAGRTPGSGRPKKKGNKK